MQRETVGSLRQRRDSPNCGFVRGESGGARKRSSGAAPLPHEGVCYVFGLFGWMDKVTCACHRRPSAEREGARAASAARAAIAADLFKTSACHDLKRVFRKVLSD